MMGKPLGVLMFLLVIPQKVLGTAETDCSCTASYCECSDLGLTSVPQGLSDTITKLGLGRNQITTLSQSGLSRYVNLVDLSVYSNQITDLQSDVFTGLGNLITIYFHFNDISNIQDGTFSSTPEMRTLYLSNNKLRSIRAEMFTGLGNLEELRLNRNEISDIRDGTFSSTPEIRYLNMSYNKLAILRANMFTGLGKLEELRLYRNEISDIPAGTFSSMLQLKVLDLYKNKLKSLRPDMFTGLGNLEDLYLQNNEITDIHVGTFSPMVNVNQIQLLANSITIFPFEDLSDIQTLSSLNLNSNQMTTLSSTAYDILLSISFKGEVNIGNNPWQCDCRMVDFKMKMTEPSSFDKQITCSQPEDLSGQKLIEVNPNDLMTGCQKPNIVRFERIGKYPLIQGQTLRLVCEASGIPTPEITVELPSGLQHKATVESGRRVTVLANGTIIVKEVTADDSGQYACIATNSDGSTKAYFSADVLSPEFTPSFPLPILNILYLIGAVAGTLVVVAIVLAIWCKCCRKDRSVAVGPDSGVVVLNTGPPAVMYSNGARVAWGHPWMAMSRV